ncbi:hypothetical protein AK812_SmicGene31050 [Symbiodinium microadriaticum]|uniref:Uncharacterized protein n=1 Tax=Symbiodinium microadriaticum TaxID=2951 RepID=A0A1Q9CXQ2_SYMMI|nr:hypothetical protein AK812_SmicGene31050 [Symbiodinium microadriaticum]
MVSVPASFDADAWFVRKRRRTSAGSAASQADVAEVETAEEAILKGVSQPRTWASHTPDSEQEKLAGFSLLSKIVREEQGWSFVEKGWWASLAPEGHGLSFPGSASVCFVVRTYRRAALVWPATLEKGSSGVETLVLDPKASSLCWVHLFNEDVEVLELVATSPQRVLAVPSKAGFWGSFSTGYFKISQPLGVALRVQARRSLLSHHEVHGFAGVPEWSLRRLAETKKWPVAAQEPGHDEDDRLTIVCLLSLDPSLVKEDIVGRLLNRQEAAPWTFEDGGIDLESLVRDTMLATEQEQALKQLAKRQGGQRSAKEVRTKVSQTYEHVAKTFAGRPDYKKAQARRKEKEKQAEKEQRARAAAVKRIYDDVDNNVDRALKAATPHGVRITTDEGNGRWKLAYSTAWAFATRSISWTAVGSKPAGAAALEQCWEWAETFAGITMSDEAATILKKLKA